MAYYDALVAKWATLTGTTAQKLAAINAATVTTATPNQPFPLSAAANVAKTSPNFSWARITQRAQAVAALPPATATDGAILAARTVVATDPGQMIDPGLPAAWGAWQAGIGALEAVGDLSAADVAAITALTTVTTSQPWWQANGYTSPVGPNDLVAAGNLT